MPSIPLPSIPLPLRAKIPFIIAGFASFLFSIWLYFIHDDTTAGIFVGLWVPSIHSLGTLLLAPGAAPEASATVERIHE
jgi:hypothetical protein